MDEREYLKYCLDEVDKLLEAKGLDLLSSFSVGTTIAGGAIGNLILSKHFNLNLPINDIDVFMDEELKASEEGKVFVRYGDEYIDVFSPDKSECFKIKETTREGILNFIITRHVFQQSPSEYAQMVLGSFDINCVEAGIFKNEDGEWELATTKSFDELLSTKEVRITNALHSFRTLIRWYKKEGELKGLFFKKNEDLRLLQVISYGNSQVISETTLTKFFDYASRRCRGWFGFRKIKAGLFEVVPNLQHKEVILFHHKERLAFGKVANLIFEASSVHFGMSRPTVSKYKELAGYSNLLRVALKLGLDSQLKSQFSRKELLQSERVLTKYPNILKEVTDFEDCSLRKCVQVLASITTFVSKQRLLDDRYFKNNFFGVIDVAFPKIYRREIELQSLYLTFIKDASNKAKVLNEQIDITIPTREQEGSFSELRSMMRLSIEGHEMNHCVGGYAGRVKAGDCRIFSIKTKAGRSTLEVNVNQGFNKAYINQHRGSSNHLAPFENQEIAIEIIKKLRTLKSSIGEKPMANEAQDPAIAIGI